MVFLLGILISFNQFFQTKSVEYQYQINDENNQTIVDVVEDVESSEEEQETKAITLLCIYESTTELVCISAAKRFTSLYYSIWQPPKID